VEKEGRLWRESLRLVGVEEDDQLIRSNSSFVASTSRTLY
jgi:hypothetical protein